MEPDETFFVDLTNPTRRGRSSPTPRGRARSSTTTIVVSRGWGYNGYAQVGDGSLTSRLRPTAINLGPVDSVAAGGFHSLAVQGGTVYSWGLGHVGQLGRAPTQPRVPLPVDGLSGVTAVSAGVFHSLALKSDGTVWAWGWNAYGQVGDGTLVDRPAAGAGGRAHRRRRHRRRRAAQPRPQGDGTVWTWGDNGAGQLGTATPARSTTARAVPGLSGVTAIGAGAYHSLAVKAGGTVAAWGWNSWGQLGDGTTTSRSAPVTVPGSDRHRVGGRRDRSQPGSGGGRPDALVGAQRHRSARAAGGGPIVDPRPRASPHRGGRHRRRRLPQRGPADGRLRVGLGLERVRPVGRRLHRRLRHPHAHHLHPRLLDLGGVGHSVAAGLDTL